MTNQNTATSAKFRLIHAARKVLGWDEQTYRIALTEITGKSSAKACSLAELDKFIDYLKGKGFKPVPKAKPTSKAKPTVSKAKTLGDSDQEQKIRALWRELHEYGFVRDPSEAALVRFITREANIDCAKWMSTLVFQKIIEKLKQWRFRAENALIKRTGKPKAELEALALAHFGDARLTKDACAKLLNLIAK